MEYILFIALPAICAGIVQGVTGFGAGIVMMMFLPSLFGVTTGAAVSSAIGSVLCIGTAYHYRKHIQYKKILMPAALYIAVSSIAIYYSTMVNQNLMKLCFGIFLIVLSVYFLFLAKDAKITPTLTVTLVCVIISAVCDGLFGIGGPLMVLYFLAICHTKEEYLGTIQSYFAICSCYAGCLRVIRGILTVSHIPNIIVGAVCILAGLYVANKIVNRLDGEKIKKLTYLLIGISGVINVVTAL